MDRREPTGAPWGKDAPAAAEGESIFDYLNVPSPPPPERPGVHEPHPAAEGVRRAGN